MPPDKDLHFCISLVKIVYMFCLFIFIMCLHPVAELEWESDALCVSDLEQFDTCDYVYSLNDVNEDDLAIIQLNIHGLPSKISSLSNLLNSCINSRSPDVVLLSETWLTPNSPAMTVPGYDFVYRDRTNK